ncbi:hypothetical protein BU24DRAFT_448926 [Aaosphaeria arxii CBS 175.79]|uniref:BRCT domain-containing protein n=1 Tax=Aaosphaeria arxii CBS 175.79 TaxID=1450172 RepID=A0A6A5XY46_9PLEO|nr:uncharacterized protein BU24DRAFT_448926 [Aaosphaeria arxii CBS 175.79]KAF2017194.1 hypothetical protein BU24DRAFT_448926 [Aaosphaeria arxii CBS 175.79]
MPPKKAAASRISVKPNALEGVSVIITGDIEGQTRSSANEILSTSGAIIEKSLNKTVQLVVLGENAGDKKLDKVNELGLETKEWDELIEEIRADDDQDEELEDSEQEDKPKRKDKGKAGTKANSRGKPNPPPEKKTASIESATSPSIVGKTVLITGTVPGHDRKSAQKIVEDAGATVAKSLNKQVEVAILGTNAGPDKLKIIEESGIDTIRWNALAAELGIEVPPEKEVADVQSGEPPDSIDDCSDGYSNDNVWGFG